MRNFDFVIPTKVLFGKDTIGRIGREISECGSKKIMLLYGKGSIFKNGVYDTVVASLKEANVEYIEMSGVKANPILSKVEEGIELCGKENIDGILAVGGGSVIDTAKAIGAGAKLTCPVWDAFEGKVRPKESLPIFTVLTISATGSEMNHLAVITNEEGKKKWSFSTGYQSFPKVTVIDPTVQASLPKNQTINGAVDVISHVLELYFDGTKDTDVMDEYSEGIIRTVMKHVKILLEDPSDYESRAQLAWCATLGLNGSNSVGRRGGDWASHNLEHSLSAYYDVAHGAGLAVMSPAWMKYVHGEDVEKFARFAERVFNITEGTNEEKALAGIEALKSFYKTIGAPVTLRELGIPKEALETLAENAAIRGAYGKLKKLTKEDSLAIYELAY